MNFSRCPTCGSPREVVLIGGLCPVCVLRTTLAGEGAEEGAGSGEAEEHAGYVGGECFAGHELEAVIGRGGMGVVYRAWQPSLQRVVALKLMIGGVFAAPAAMRRFHREAAIAAGLRHAHVVPIYEVGVSEGQAYYTMEYVAGRSLAAMTRADGPVAPRRAAELLVAVADAVAAAHALGILHLDLKPANVLLDAVGRPRVADFGLAHREDAPLADITAPLEAMGSPPYMAPERIAGGAGSTSGVRTGPLTDVYGLGAILYHCLTGRAPFDGVSVAEILVRVERDAPVSPRRTHPEVSRDLETICLRALEKDPARRYASAAAFREDLERFLSGRAVLARPLGVAGRVARWVRRNPAPAAVVAVVVAASLAVGALGWHATRLARTDALKTYAADMLAASIAVEAGDFSRARALLAEHAPEAAGGGPQGFEWGLLTELARDRSRSSWAAHPWLATGAAFSPDGARIATTGEDGELRLWEDGKLVRQWAAHAGMAWQPAFAADGKRVLSAGADGRVALWDAASSEAVFTFPGQQGSLSLDGGRIATTDASFFFWRAAGTRVQVWDAAGGELVREWALAARGVVLSPDGARVAVTFPGGGMKLFAVETGELLAATDERGEGLAPRFSPDGRFVACGDARAAVCWDTETGVARTLPHPNRVWAVAFGPDSADVLTGCGDRRVRRFGMRDGVGIGEPFGCSNEVWGVAVSPDGASVATATKDGVLALWPARTERVERDFPHAGWVRPRFSADGRRLVATGAEAGGFAGYSDDGAMGWGIAPGGGEVWVRETATAGREIGAASVALDEAEGAVSRDGRWLLLKRRRGEMDTREVWLVDVARGRAVALAGHHDEVKGVALSPDGRRAAYGSVDGNIYLWDVAPRRLRAVLRGHLNEVSDVAFSPDGTRLASIEVTHALKLWHLPTERLLMSLAMPEAGAHVVFSPDGRALAHTLFGEAGAEGVRVYRIE